MIGLRFMGKRTIGEFQPFEFVIVLAVAELASTPMQDISTPILYGIIPLVTVFIAHYVLTRISAKSIRFRKFFNGKPMIVIDGNGINYEIIKKLSLDVNDILEMIREQGYFSVEEVSYAILETNGKLSVLQNPDAQAPKAVPATLIVEGRVLDENLEMINGKRQNLDKILRNYKLAIEDVLLLTAESKKIFIQPKYDKYISFEVADEI
jgi:uncharacterized membrane protein YcaP (DUF421 family)